MSNRPSSSSCARTLQCGRFQFELYPRRTLVMGVLNITPDSFSDGGRFLAKDTALAQAEQMIEEGAHLIDIGAESSRPGAPELGVQEELDRLLPVLQALQGTKAAISVDTRKPEVMLAALELGADMLNDIEGFARLLLKPLEYPALQRIIQEKRPALCIMHMQGNPLTMQKQPIYREPVQEIRDFLQTRANGLLSLGVLPEQLVFDPGIGFGKHLQHNLALLRDIAKLRADLGPVLIGLSRKSMLGELTGRPVDKRLAASLAGALWAAQQGASIVRVHDVAQTVDALKVWAALQADADNKN